MGLFNTTASLINNVTCEFKEDGLCTFENLAIDTMGSGYILDFEITYPSSATVPPVQSSPFDVGGRSMSLEFLTDITLQGEYESMTLEVGVWDNGIGALIDPALSPPMVNCTLSLNGGYGQVMLDGDIYADVIGGIATFDDVQVTGSLMDATLEASCSDMADFMETTTSQPFTTHPYPRTGHLRSNKGNFNYKGTAGAISSVLDSLKEAVES